MTNIEKLASQLEQAHYEWTRALNSFGPMSSITAAKKAAYEVARDRVAAIRDDS